MDDDGERELCEKRLGTTLRGKWTIDRLLGIGGMAAVYAATHKIGRVEAIKILHPEVARSKDLRARFEREAQAVNRFHHPGVVEIRDIDVTEDGAPFLVMELLEGESLGDRAARTGGVDLPELLRLTDELLDVLAAAHAQGIIHRDIKLDNLFIEKGGRLKVLDFGVARMRDGVKTAMRTRTGATLGTVSYMAPEQVRGISVDHRADLFAVGATMFRMIARRRLHEARTEPELLVMMATRPAPPLASVAPQAPQGLCAVVDRALAFEPGHRYPDARTMQEDVRATARGEAPPFASAQLAAGDLPSTGAPGMTPIGGAPAAEPPTKALGRVERTADDPAGAAATAGALNATGQAMPGAAPGDPIGTELSLGGAPSWGGGAANAQAGPMSSTLARPVTPEGTQQSMQGAATAGTPQPAPVSVQAATPVSMVGAPVSMAGAPVSMVSRTAPGGAQSTLDGSEEAARTASPRRSSAAPVILALGGAALTLTLLLGVGLWWVLRVGDEGAEVPTIELPDADGNAAEQPTPLPNRATGSATGEARSPGAAPTAPAKPPSPSQPASTTTTKPSIPGATPTPAPTFTFPVNPQGGKKKEPKKKDKDKGKDKDDD